MAPRTKMKPNIAPNVVQVCKFHKRKTSESEQKNGENNSANEQKNGENNLEGKWKKSVSDFLMAA